MTAVIPLFPLKLVAFPGEMLNLHIFEPRYIQLIKDCLSEERGRNFGVCVFLDELKPFGTEVELLEVDKTYEDGRMDIKTKATRAFKILTFENPLGERMYAGGEVDFLRNDIRVSNVQYQEFIFYLKEMLRLLSFQGELERLEVNSFTFAHHLGLKLEEECQLLIMESEADRMDFLTAHLKRVIPVARELENARQKIKMNGHFRYLDPLDF